MGRCGRGRKSEEFPDLEYSVAVRARARFGALAQSPNSGRVEEIFQSHSSLLISHLFLHLCIPFTSLEIIENTHQNVCELSVRPYELYVRTMGERRFGEDGKFRGKGTWGDFFPRPLIIQLVLARITIATLTY